MLKKWFHAYNIWLTQTFLMPANMLVVLSGSHFLWCLIFEDEGIHGYAHNIDDWTHIFPSTGNPLKTDFPPFFVD